MLIPQYPIAVHETEIAKVLSLPPAAQPGAGAGADIDLSLFICFTNRSGSNFLADLLHATGEMREGKECFNHPGVVRTARERQLKSLADYCRFQAERSAKKRRFVSKVSAGQLFMLARLGYLGTVFPNPRFIHIQRYDVVAQGISHLIAKSTRAFSSFHTPQVAEGDVAFDADHITAIIDGVDRANAALRDFLIFNRLDHMPVLYEHLAADPGRVVKRIFAWIGLDPPVLQRGKLRRERQVSSIKDDWYARYVAERCKGDTPARHFSLFGKN